MLVIINIHLWANLECFITLIVFEAQQAQGLILQVYSGSAIHVFLSEEACRRGSVQTRERADEEGFLVCTLPVSE